MFFRIHHSQNKEERKLVEHPFFSEKSLWETKKQSDGKKLTPAKKFAISWLATSLHLLQSRHQSKLTMLDQKSSFGEYVAQNFSYGSHKFLNS